MDNFNSNINDITNNNNNNNNNEDERLSTQELFRELDYDFIGLRKLGDETYTYKAIDVRVQDTLELPIIIQWPDSVINFEFTIKPTDIFFSIYFVAAPENDMERQHYSEVEIETVKDKEKVSCDEITEGTYKPPCEGVVFFVWDNTNDWSAIKNVSYKIEVIEPSFKGMEQERRLKSSEILKDVIDDNVACGISLADAADRGYVLACNDKIQIKQMQLIEETLARKTAELQRLRQLEKDLVSTINDNLEKISGLCIRSLNKHLLSVVIGFLDTSITSPVSRVNKFWSKIANDIRINGPVSGTDYKYLATAKLRPRTIILDDEIDKLCITSADSPDNIDENNANDEIFKTDANSKIRKKVTIKKRDYVNKKNHSDNEGESVYSDSATDDSGDAYIKIDPRVDIKFPLRENRTKTNDDGDDDVISRRRVRVSTIYDVYPQLHPEYGHNEVPEKVNNDTLYQQYRMSIADRSLSNLTKNSKEETIVDDKINLSLDVDVTQTTIQSNEVKEVKEKRKDIKLPKVAESKTKAEKKKANKKKIDDKNIDISRQEITNGNNDTANSNLATSNKHSNISRDEFIRIMDIAEPIFELIVEFNARKKKLRREIKSWIVAFELVYCAPPEKKEKKSIARDMYEDYNCTSTHIKIRRRKMDKILKFLNISLKDYISLYRYRNNGATSISN